MYCSFHSSYKITPSFFDIWMRILKAVPGSVLWVFAGERQTELNLKNEAAKRGVDPTRLVFAGQLPYVEHLARLRHADLYLDTLPFNGGTTSSDALWAGLPMLTCSGEAFAARMSGSLLASLGLPELIAPTKAAYEALGVSLASDKVGLRALRDRLLASHRTAGLFNTARTTRAIEAAYVTMWDRAQRGLLPTGFSVPKAVQPAIVTTMSEQPPSRSVWSRMFARDK